MHVSFEMFLHLEPLKSNKLKQFFSIIDTRYVTDIKQAEQGLMSTLMSTRNRVGRFQLGCKKRTLYVHRYIRGFEVSKASKKLNIFLI